MNKKVILPVACLLAIAGCSAFSLVTKPNYTPVKAYDTSSLPTVIDLNDLEAAEIRNYYSGLNSMDDNQRTGTNLLKNLKNILKKDQKYYSYDSGNAIWQIYEIADRDWEKSPASSTTYGTYNSATNTIVNYQYGTSSTNAKNNPYIHALYFNRNIENQVRAWGSHEQDEWGINREHVWAKSQGFDTKPSGSTGGARGDPFHLIAGAGWANNVHSDNFYGYVDKSKSYTNCGGKYSNQSGNYRGISLTQGSETVFEPQDSDKGDIARAIFYMAARYNNYAGSDADGINANNPNLQLTQSAAGQSGYTSSASNPGKMGILKDLLEWNKIDPVDSYEIHRNNILYKNYTNNRNPFIDFPEWAEYIWGKDAWLKSANPQTDRLNDSGVSVTTTKIETSPNEVTKVTATSSNGSEITWTVEDPTIVELSKTTSASGEEITVKALKEGETKITASATVESEVVTSTITVKVSKKGFVFGLSTTHIIIIAVVAGVVIVGAIIFFLLPNSRAKRRISKKVQQTVKNATKSSTSSSSKSKSTSKKKKK